MSEVFASLPQTERAVWPDSTRVEAGELSWNGRTAASLLEEFGSPLYLVDTDELAVRAARFKAAAERAFAGETVAVSYAAKALLSVAIARIMHQAGLLIDTCSMGEMRIALAAGIPGNQLVLHGNNKTDAELEFAIAHDFCKIVVDEPLEPERIATIARRIGKRARVMLRVTTGIHAGGHEYISTAHEDQKFGVPLMPIGSDDLREGKACQVLQAMLRLPELEIVGIHSHIGSQIHDAHAFIDAAERMMRLRKTFFDVTGFMLPEVDLGGGFSVAYTAGEDAMDIEQALGDMASAITRINERLNMPNPAISFEPGRWIAAPAGVTLYRVGTVKPVALPHGTLDSAGKPLPERVYVSVDGGMSDNIRPALYGAQYEVRLANRASSAPERSSRVVGMHCESGDILVKECILPSDIHRGDILAVPVTGAYCRTMASNYNQVPIPAVVGVSARGASVLIRRGSIDELIAAQMTQPAAISAPTPTSQPRALRVGLLGAGVVGSQLIRLLVERREELVRLLGSELILSGIAVRHPEAVKQAWIDTSLLTTDANAVIDNADLVVELIGGVEPARSLIARALSAGKSVVTANKAVLAQHGAELFALAEAHNAELYFEAAVGGVVPIIRVLRESLAGDDVTSVLGIVNGTTNYILDEMTTKRLDFAVALKQAQERGYAEADPTGDVDGIDAANKAAILATLAFHQDVKLHEVSVEGIGAITADDVEAARAEHKVIKLLAVLQRERDEQGVEGVAVRVYPALISDQHPLANVHGSFNAVYVHAQFAGDMMLYGRGAGGEPTASAVLGDVLAAARHRLQGAAGARLVLHEHRRIIPLQENHSAFAVRFLISDKPGVLAAIARKFADHGVSINGVNQDLKPTLHDPGYSGELQQLRIVTHQCDEMTLRATIADVYTLDFVQGTPSLLRIVE